MTGQLPDSATLTPIEAEFWAPDGQVPNELELVVRGSPVTAEKLWSHALRQAREYSYRGQNMTSVSVDLVLRGWDLERILSKQLAIYSRYATSSVVDLLEAGFGVLATGSIPHADIVLPAMDSLWTERLAELLAVSEQRNPYKLRW